MAHRVRDVVRDVLQSHPSSDAQASRKTAQIARAIARSVQRTLDIDVDDPDLDALIVAEVRAVAGGLFVAVITANARADDVTSWQRIDRQQEKLDALSALFRNRMATELARKRVPPLRFSVVPVGGYGEEGGDGGGA